MLLFKLIMYLRDRLLVRQYPQIELLLIDLVHESSMLFL
jgi:hypothetical protein